MLGKRASAEADAVGRIIPSREIEGAKLPAVQNRVRCCKVISPYRLQRAVRADSKEFWAHESIFGGGKTDKNPRRKREDEVGLLLGLCFGCRSVPVESSPGAGHV